MKERRVRNRFAQFSPSRNRPERTNYRCAGRKFGKVLQEITSPNLWTPSCEVYSGNLCVTGLAVLSASGPCDTKKKNEKAIFWRRIMHSLIYRNISEYCSFWPLESWKWLPSGKVKTEWYEAGLQRYPATTVGDRKKKMGPKKKKDRDGPHNRKDGERLLKVQLGQWKDEEVWYEGFSEMEPSPWEFMREPAGSWGRVLVLRNRIWSSGSQSG